MEQVRVEFLGGPMDGDACDMNLGENPPATVVAHKDEDFYSYQLEEREGQWVLVFLRKETAEDFS